MRRIEGINKTEGREGRKELKRQRNSLKCFTNGCPSICSIVRMKELASHNCCINALISLLAPIVYFH